MIAWKNSEIPDILKKYNIDYKEILDDSKFPLKEKELPDLCADRIDYFLREIEIRNRISLEEINEFLDSFRIIDNLWVLNERDLAKKYAHLFLEMNNKVWSEIESAIMFRTTGDLIKYLLEKKIISNNDLFTTDKEFWLKIEPFISKDKYLKILIDKANNKFNFKISDKDDYDLHVLCKSRVVDPLFLENGRLKRLSNVNNEFSLLRKKYSNFKEYYIKFLERRN